MIKLNFSKNENKRKIYCLKNDYKDDSLVIDTDSSLITSRSDALKSRIVFRIGGSCTLFP